MRPVYIIRQIFLFVQCCLIFFRFLLNFQEQIEPDCFLRIYLITKKRFIIQTNSFTASMGPWQRDTFPMELAKIAAFFEWWCFDAVPPTCLAGAAWLPLNDQSCLYRLPNVMRFQIWRDNMMEVYSFPSHGFWKLDLYILLRFNYRSLQSLRPVGCTTVLCEHDILW